MAKSPIEPAEPRAPRQRRERSSIDGMDLSSVMKARKEQDRVLHARLKQIDREIDKLMREHEEIIEILGIKREDAPAPADRDVSADDKPKWQHTCADCGGHAGPNARGDCGDCGAGPFEQAK